jgi:hypothetical protein
MLLFELEDRAVALLDPNHALVFDSNQWRAGSTDLARSALLNGSQLTPTAFCEAFPLAGAWLLRAGYITLDEIE